MPRGMDQRGNAFKPTRVSKEFGELLRTVAKPARQSSAAEKARDAARYLANKNYQPPTQAFEVDFDALYAAIYSICDRVLETQINHGYEVAIQNVPVRKVFQGGGRARTRTLSISELRAESAMFLRLFSPSERKGMLGPRGGQVRTGSYLVSRVGVETVTHRPRGTSWHNTEGSRRLHLVGAKTRTVYDAEHDVNRQVVIPGTGHLEFESHDPNMSSYLNYEGRRAMRGARMEGQVNNPLQVGNLRDVGYGAVSSGTKNVDVGRKLPRGMQQLYLGGTLKNSIHMSEDSRGYRHIVAGGGDAYYAQYMEFGTSHVAARPFMRPALAAMERTFKASLISELQKLSRSNPVG